MKVQEAFNYLEGLCDSQQRQINILGNWIKTLEKRIEIIETTGFLATNSPIKHDTQNGGAR